MAKIWYCLPQHRFCNFCIFNAADSPSVHPLYCYFLVLILFPDNNLSKYQGILTKPGMCIDIKEICFGIANGQISSIFDRVICPQYYNGGVLLFYIFIDRVICPSQEGGGLLSLNIFIYR